MRRPQRGCRRRDDFDRRRRGVDAEENSAMDHLSAERARRASPGALLCFTRTSTVFSLATHRLPGSVCHPKAVLVRRSLGNKKKLGVSFASINFENVILAWPTYGSQHDRWCTLAQFSSSKVILTTTALLSRWILMRNVNMTHSSLSSAQSDSPIGEIY